MFKPTILFADNDRDFLETRSEFLEKHGYHVILANGPVEAKRVLEQKKIDLAILDLRLINNDDDKDLSGLKVAKESAPAIPKIILTKFPTWEAVREALGPTLDGMAPTVDFIDKMEGPQALLTAVRKALRLNLRVEADDHPPENPTPPVTPGLVIDYDNKEVFVETRHIKLPKLQFKLLTFMAERSGKVCGREELLLHLYGETAYDRFDGALDSQIYRMRQKIESDPANPKYLITVSGFGYKLVR